jgi:hypothetical protein
LTINTISKEMATAQEQMLVEVERQAEAMRVADVNLAQAGDAESVPHALQLLEFLEGVGMLLALLQFDGVLDADELKSTGRR